MFQPKVLKPNPSPSLLDDVRESCARISDEAQHVSINKEKIAGYVADLLDRYDITTGLNDDHFVSKDREETASYIVALDSLNFGSGYFRQARDEGIAFGYTIFAKGLKAAFERGEMNAPEKWVFAMASDFYRVFDIPAGQNAHIDQLFQHFVQHLRETGKKIITEYQGKSMNLINAAQGSAVKLVETLASWPTFHDFAQYKGRDIPILKRAQIMAADLHLAGVTDFKDIGALTIFADNRVPHVLRHDGILSYTPALAEKIDKLIPLERGSEEETELRAASIHVAELMKAQALKQGRNVTAMNIDHILWRRGGEPAISAKPTHRTTTVWY